MIFYTFSCIVTLFNRTLLFMSTYFEKWAHDLGHLVIVKCKWVWVLAGWWRLLILVGQSLLYIVHIFSTTSFSDLDFRIRVGRTYPCQYFSNKWSVMIMQTSFDLKSMWHYIKKLLLIICKLSMYVIGVGLF